MRKMLFCALFFPLISTLSSASSSQDRPLLTNLSLLIGHTGDEKAPSTDLLLDAGMVIPMPSQEPSNGSKSGLQLPLDVPQKIKTTLNLKRVDLTHVRLTEQIVGQKTSLTSVERGKSVGAQVELLSRSSGTATFRVQFESGGSVLNDTRVAVELGKRAVVGALEGRPGIYLFLVVNPLSTTTLPSTREKPLLLDMVLPRYPAREIASRTEGRVRVEGVVDREGRPQDLKVLETPAENFSASALDAIRQWRYRPAENQGQKVAVKLTWMLAFVLE